MFIAQYFIINRLNDSKLNIYNEDNWMINKNFLDAKTKIIINKKN